MRASDSTSAIHGDNCAHAACEKKADIDTAKNILGALRDITDEQLEARFCRCRLLFNRGT